MDGFPFQYQLFSQIFRQSPKTSIHTGQIQLILGLEIMVNDSLGHTLTAAYIVNGTGSISLFREFLQRALHNPVFCLLIFLFPLHEHSPPKLLTTRSIYD